MIVHLLDVDMTLCRFILVYTNGMKVRNRSVFSSVSHPATLQNLVTKDLATEVIQESLLRAKRLGQQEVKTFVQDRLIVAEQCDKPDVSIYEPVRKNNAPTFATLYQVVKHTKDRDQKTYEGRQKCSPKANYFL